MKQEVYKIASVYYNVTIYTGDIENAGTDSDVSVKLYFKSGAVLSKSDLDKKDHDDFERGTNDTYTIEANDDYGEIRYVDKWYFKHFKRV